MQAAQDGATDAATAATDDLAIWTGLPCAVALLDARGQVLRANPAFGALADQPGWQWLTPAARTALLQHLSRPEDFSLELSAEDQAAWLLQARWDAAAAAHITLWTDGGARQQLSQFHLLAQHVPSLIALYQAGSHRCLFANRGYAQAFGLSEQGIVGLSFREIIGPEAAALVEPVVLEVERSGRPGSYERPLRLPDGSQRWIEAHVIPYPDAQGRVQAAFVQLVDITHHRLAESALRESEQRFAKFMQASDEGIVFHSAGRVTDANPALCRLVGADLAQLLGRSIFDFVPAEEQAKVRRYMLAAQELRYESVLLTMAGELIPVEFIVRSLERGGEQLRMAIVRDIRDRLAAQARIHHLARHDSLTQLLNRAAFMELLAPALERAKQRGEGLALLFIDLDNFKRVNDSLGHLEGDKVLSTVAQRLRNCLRASDLVSRFGGDEFVVLLGDVHGREDVQVVLRALLSVVEVPLLADGRDLSVTPSIGVALFPEHGGRAEELIQHADTAMYLAKARGRAGYQFFAPELVGRAYAELVLESELVEALSQGQFLLYYQPQVDARDGRLVGAEALLRWQHPRRGLLGPDVFINVAERHRLMVALGEWVMAEAARQSRLWHESGLAPVPIAVNLSSMQFRLDGFADTVRAVLAEAGVPGQWLELELTERMLVDELDNAPATLAALRELGLGVSADDFGTGYTSLAHLTQLPLDKLKIDQSFIAPLPGDTGAAAITRAMVQMARDLGLRVGAEGVRNEAQRALLAEWGCDELQGELIGNSMPAADFEAWVRARQ